MAADDDDEAPPVPKARPLPMGAGPLEGTDYGLPDVLTPRQAAEILGVIPVTVYRMIRRGELEAAPAPAGDSSRWHLDRDTVLEAAGSGRLARWASDTQRDLRVRVATLERGAASDADHVMRWVDRAVKDGHRIAALEGRLAALEAHLGLAGTPSPAPKPPV